jgi:hypothetical protein
VQAPLTSKCQASSVFDNDSPVEAKQEVTSVMQYCLHLLQNSKYITDPDKKWEMRLKKLST